MAKAGSFSERRGPQPPEVARAVSPSPAIVQNHVPQFPTGTP